MFIWPGQVSTIYYYFFLLPNNWTKIYNILFRWYKLSSGSSKLPETPYLASEVTEEVTYPVLVPPNNEYVSHNVDFKVGIKNDLKTE